MVVAELRKKREMHAMVNINSHAFICLLSFPLDLLSFSLLTSSFFLAFIFLFILHLGIPFHLQTFFLFFFSCLPLSFLAFFYTPIAFLTSFSLISYTGFWTSIQGKIPKVIESYFQLFCPLMKFTFQFIIIIIVKTTETLISMIMSRSESLQGLARSDSNAQSFCILFNVMKIELNYYISFFFYFLFLI